MASRSRAPSRPTSTAPHDASPSSRQAQFLSGSYNGLLTNTRTLIGLLQPQSHATTVDVLAHVTAVLADIKDFTKRLDEADPEDVDLDGGKWQDKLDSEGTLIWNQSTIRKYRAAEGEAVDGVEGPVAGGGRKKDHEHVIVAKLRVISYKLIVLGVVDPRNKEVICSNLNLSTKAALACLSLPKPDYLTTQDLLTAGSALAKALGSPPPLRPSAASPHPPTSEAAKAVLGHLLARARASVLQENETVASFAMTQIKNNLEMAGCLGGREKAKLAQTAHELGKMMLVQGREHLDAAEVEEDVERKEGEKVKANKRVELARGWLMWGVALLDEPRSNLGQAKELRISSLRLLAQAYLEADPPLRAEGEATLETLLEAEPDSPSLFRRYIRLVVQRDSDGQRIVKAFGEAIKHLPWNEADGAKLLSEVQQLSPVRQSQRYPILTALADGALARLSEVREIPAGTAEIDPASDDGNGPLLFLGQLVMTTMFGIASTDYPQLVALFDKMVDGLGSAHRLPPNPAFVLATYAWKQGDSATKANRHREAAEWFLLAAHRITTAVHETVAPKSRRKAALALTHLNKFDEAEEALAVQEPGPILARTEFARFNNFAQAGRVDDARLALQRMVGGADFELNMLFWASEIAKDAPEHGPALQGAVLSGLLELYKRDAISAMKEQVDGLVLTRCLIRTTVTQLETASREQRIELAELLIDQYKTGHTFAAQKLGQADTDEDALLKNVKWLYTSAHGVVVLATQTLDLPARLTSQLYAEIADLIEIAQQVAPDPAMQVRLYLCRFGALGERIRRVREADAGSDEARAGHGNLLPKLHKLRVELARARREDPQLEGLDDLQAAVIGLQVEGYGAVQDWTALENVVASFTEDQPQLGAEVLKACATKAVGFEQAQPETGLYILRLTLYQLQTRGDVGASSLASWIRLVLKCLNDMGAAYTPDALQTVKDGLVLVQRDVDGYGKEEVAWLSSFAWDKGCEYLSGAAPGDEGGGGEGADGLGGGAEGDAAGEAGAEWCELGIELARLGRVEWYETIKRQWAEIGQEQVAQELMI